MAWATHLLRGFLNLWGVAGQRWERKDRHAINSLAGSVGIPDAVEQGRQAEWAARDMLELVTALRCSDVGEGYSWKTRERCEC